MPGPFRGALRGLMSNGGSSTGSMMGQTNWVYLAAAVVLLAVVVVLIALTIREYYLLKKKGS